MTRHHTRMDSPIGPLLLVSDGAALCGLYMDTPSCPAIPADADWSEDAVLADTRRQLDEYFAGERTDFDLPLAGEGTAFQQTVWAALCDIAFGHTESYGELASRIGAPTASRAVGMANGRNPISIIVPCHRVIGANGSLTGYGGGLERKQWLLAHEARIAGLTLT
ncbi:methylated-DNA--[protein]-cysteine S-methyltransferase [uncultured Abyssibacter sp.]|uniref:methylated-DNA--[protein]-cysteine S-methyltransferase n=1 Tax=uncultured Abyssibacter sp. TaxID=2320202 RepID=UPI0032B21A6E